jgi:uncharacterized protein YoxC
MRWQVVLTVLDILFLVVILVIYLNWVARLLNSISATLGKVTFGVRAVETQCAVIGPAVKQVNANLAAAAGNLEQSAVAAERLAR